ncbi:ElyC/SanA/YdcF family protein [Gelidibacter mesophilus]|uniref:ElyC/SanA/YdcF family protein n=1 Tax=Gelidibacter mesophilus TaxID=169050 RepID=UPI00040CA33F|nr:ElyC/SanA/YdcF family protein [Gelidibacter mesophilus]
MRFITYKTWILIILFSSSGFCQTNETNTSKTILLILGSGNLETSVARAEVGFNLFTSKKDVDYIIVSGGCGAHSSSICEATIMADVLIEKGVPENIIYKEEKSKSTAQNYCYSRDLRHSDGNKLINEGDYLFVVSSHWHAMSVSGCFSDKDLVNSKYVIEGSIIPKPDNKTDYGAIYENCINNSNYCKSVLWPKVDAAYTMETSGKKQDQNLQSLFLRDIMAKTKDSTTAYSTISEELSDLPEIWKSNIDASYFNTFENLIYLFKDQQFIALQPGSSTIENGYPKSLNNLFSNLSDYWRQGHLDAAFFNPKTKHVYFFKGDQYVRIPFKRNKMQSAEGPKKITDLVSEWPFNWSTGNIDAAIFNEHANVVIMYRGQESLKLKFDAENLILVDDTPQKVGLDWPTEMWGKRN